jgi:glycosyltransferase involved in cell wall biosynthesis
MKIAQVAPLFESVPPSGYGGTERVVSFLTEELVAQGHDVTLFASGDSVTRARLVPVVENSLRTDPDRHDPVLYHAILLDHVFDVAQAFDIVHFHTEYLHFPLAKRMRTPHLTTLHGRLDLPDLVPLYQRFRRQPLVSISDSQREPLSWANWTGTVYHGLPVDLFDFHPEPDDYFAFVGRMSPEKGVEQAIEIARACRTPLRIAAKIDPTEQSYFEEHVKPLLDGPYVEFVGEIGEKEKNDFLGQASALIFSIDWPEPFGLVQIESFACGTPVIAFRCGSVPEIVEDGVTGFVVNDVPEAVAAIERIVKLRRRDCRLAFERRFSATRMANDYLRLYGQMIVQGDDLRIVGGRSG